MEDCLELRDPGVTSQIRQSNKDIRAGRTRPAEELLRELATIAAKLIFDSLRPKIPVTH